MSLQPKSLSLRTLFFTLVSFFLLLSVLVPVAAQSKRQVLVLDYEGPVTPAMLSYLERGLTHAESINAEAVVFELDTPGGSVDITHELTQVIQQSSVPVVVYVYPSRAWAASAGTLITLSGHFAAMAPESLIGAASPVGSQGEDLPETAKHKAEEALAASARALAERRGEAVVKWAEQTVLSAKAATAEEALSVGAIDLIANNVTDLLQQLDGRKVEMDGVERTMDLQAAEVVEFQSNFVEDLLAVLSNPTVAVILLTLGLNAILYELSAPGGYVAGAVGIIALLLAFYSLGTLDANYAGLAFILLAFGLFIIDLKVHTGGALTVGGLISFVLGAAMLFNTPYYPIPWAAIMGLAVAMGLFVIFALSAVVKTQRHAPVTGADSLLGQSGVARSVLDPRGMVYVMGAYWEATTEGAFISAGSPVVVVRREGRLLWVRESG
jgi:membrane-bound serine protease (ClpP class)